MKMFISVSCALLAEITFLKLVRFLPSNNVSIVVILLAVSILAVSLLHKGE